MSTKSEKNVPNEFDEVDEYNPDLIQRTIVDFHLCDKQGNMIPFEGICDYIHKSELTLYGFIISPMPIEWKDTLNNSVTTVNESQNLSLDEINGMAARTYNKKNKGVHNNSNTSSSSMVNESAQMQTDGCVYAALGGEKASSCALEPLNHHDIQTGDLVDGYCPRTLKWYESKILECRTDDNGEPQVKLHFQGWNGKHDEWISRFSERIVGHGTSKIIMLQAAEAASELIPWFDHENLMKKVKTKLGCNNPPKREKISVAINGIDDWCIDYSYGNPSLWLVSSAGIWYRIASILSPNGFRGSPNTDYFNFYKSAWEKYVCASHVIMCLLDFIPTNPKLTLQVVVDEVTDRSKNMISEVVILQNYEFLIEQISVLDKPESWSIKFEFSNCTFVQQLKKEGSQFLSSGGIIGMASMSSSSVAAAPYSSSAVLKRRKNLAIKYVENENKLFESMKCKRKRDELPPEKKKEEKLPFNGVPIEEVRAFRLKAKNLMEDKEYWHMQSRLGEQIKPFPISSSGGFFISEELTGVFLGVWSFLAGFRKVLNIPYISLDVFQSYLVSSSQPYSIRTGSSNIEQHSLHPFLSELFIVFVSTILSDSDRKRWPSMIYSDQKAMTRKEKKGTSRLVFPMFPNAEVEFANIALAKKQAALEMELDSSNGNSSSGSQYKCMRCMRDFLSLQGLQYHQDNNVCKKYDSGVSLKAGEINNLLSAEDIERCRKLDKLSLNQCLRNGHMWVEILKLLIIEEKKFVMNNLFDPIDECSKIIDIVINDTNALPFLKPVDPIQEGVPQYWTIISKPMDLGTIKERIKSGWYYEDFSAPREKISVSGVEEGRHCVNDFYQINDDVDVYCEELKIWYPGKVVDVETSTQEANTSSMFIGSNSNESKTNLLQSVFIELEGWGKFNRLWLCSNSILIRPGHGVSSDASLRHEKPEDLEMKIHKLSQATESEISKSNAMSIGDEKLASLSPSGNDAANIEYPDMAPTNDKSRGAGVDGIVGDVRQVWANCELFMEESGHPFLDNARSCSQLFEALLSSRVTSKLNLKDIDFDINCPDRNDASNFRDIVTFLDDKEFFSMGIDKKLNILKFLCDLCLKSSTFKEGVELVQENEVEKMRTSSKNAQSSEVHHIDESGVDRSTNSLDEVPADFMAVSDNNASAQASLLLKHPPAKSAAAGKNSHLILADFKLVSFGKDREHRVFYYIPSDSSLRVFCETHKFVDAKSSLNLNDVKNESGEYVQSSGPLLISSKRSWLVFNGLEAINSLYNWLSTHGIRESKVRKKLEKWIESKGLAFKIAENAIEKKFRRTKSQEKNIQEEGNLQLDIRISKKIFFGRDSNSNSNSNNGNNSINRNINTTTKNNSKESSEKNLKSDNVVALKSQNTSELNLYDDSKCFYCSLGDNEDKILLCDGPNCNREFHMYCLVPAPLDIPEGEWICPECRKELSPSNLSLSLMTNSIKSSSPVSKSTFGASITTFNSSFISAPISKAMKDESISAASIDFEELDDWAATLPSDINDMDIVSTIPSGVVISKESALLPSLQNNVLSNNTSEVLEHSKFWMSQQCLESKEDNFFGNMPRLFLKTVDLTEFRQLGIVVKEINGRVYVTKFKYAKSVNSMIEGSASKIAGIKIGDQIVFVRDSVVKSIAIIQNEMKILLAHQANSPSKLLLSIGVLRRSKYLKNREFIELLMADATYSETLEAQALEDANLELNYLKAVLENKFCSEISKPVSEYVDYLLSFCDQDYLPSNLLGLIYDISSIASHIYLVSWDWIDNWREILFSKLLPLFAQSVMSGCNAEHNMREISAVLSNYLIDFESCMYSHGNAFDAAWIETGDRNNWLFNIKKASTFPSISLSLSVLLEKIQWNNYLWATHPIIVSSKGVKDHMQAPQPLYYFKDGHRAMTDFLTRNQKYWGDNCDVFVSQNNAISCNQSAVRYFLNGNRNNHALCRPFAQIDFDIDDPIKLSSSSSSNIAPFNTRSSDSDISSRGSGANDLIEDTVDNSGTFFHLNNIANCLLSILERNPLYISLPILQQSKANTNSSKNESATKLFSIITVKIKDRYYEKFADFEMDLLRFRDALLRELPDYTPNIQAIFSEITQVYTSQVFKKAIDLADSLTYNMYVHRDQMNENQSYCNEVIMEATLSSKLKLNTILNSPCWKPSMVILLKNSLYEILRQYKVVDLGENFKHQVSNKDISSFSHEDFACSYAEFTDIFKLCANQCRRPDGSKSEFSAKIAKDAKALASSIILPLQFLNNNFIVNKSVVDGSLENLIDAFEIEHGNCLSVVVPRESYICENGVNKEKLDDSKLYFNKGIVVGLRVCLKSYSLLAQSERDSLLRWKSIKVRWLNGTEKEKSEASALVASSPLLARMFDSLNPWEVYKVKRNSSK